MRRVFCLILTVLFAVVLPVLPILAQDGLYFTAINNTILELSDKTMPVRYKGMYYVPCSVFNSIELKTYCLYSKSTQMVMISDLENILYFDMSAGSCYDEAEESFPYVAIYQNDTAYIPALFTADYFGITYDYLISDYAPVIRLTKGSVLSNDAFLRGAAAIMESRLAQYNADHASAASTETPAPAETPVPTELPGETPGPIESPLPTSRPLETPQPSATPVPTATPEPIRSNVNVYIAVLGLGDDSEAVAEMLMKRGYIPCFFFSAEDIRSRPETVRRLQGIGCGIGIRFENALAEEYEDASALLREAARTYTFLVASPAPITKAAGRSAENSGLRIWSAQPPESELYPLLEQLEQAEDRCDLILDGSISLSQASILADHLQADAYTVKQITELTETALHAIEKKALVQ
jgi:hypothetical protein